MPYSKDLSGGPHLASGISSKSIALRRQSPMYLGPSRGLEVVSVVDGILPPKLDFSDDEARSECHESSVPEPPVAAPARILL